MRSESRLLNLCTVITVTRDLKFNSVVNSMHHVGYRTKHEHARTLYQNAVDYCLKSVGLVQSYVS